MTLSRRDFLKLMGGTAAALSFPSVLLQGFQKALAQAAERTAVIWLQAQSCSGCSVSLLNSIDPDIASVITQVISLNYHQTLMGGTGDVAIRVLEEAVEKQRKDFVLIVEGSVPTRSDWCCTIGEVNGRPVGAKEWVEKLGSQAKAIIAVGTCSAYGGIPAATIRADGNNPTGAKSISDILPGKKIINVPGCPPHPDWMIGTISHLLLKGIPDLDEYNRPRLFYGKTVHEQCEHLAAYKAGNFAQRWGEPGCLYLLGCLGMDSNCDIPKRKWLGVSSCTGSGSGCIGCTEAVFPDTGSRGIYKHLYADAGEIARIEDPQIRHAVLNLQDGGAING
ncbi:MAG TPA: hydrogenase small subunit [Thermodesulfobacteriota bacterium]|nr:hydrogenase small subunit [Deltaproteobacteria bacterium]HNU70893.1 hydrogenase small subunit [Thermodesulfobacteriota bacterium]HOC38780.1 hydrogenase small subunit [Thermodesulfobacteriota bacterium]